MQIRRTAAALTSAAALSITGVAMATPAQAAPPIQAGNLVAINVSDIDLDLLNDVQVEILNNALNNNNVNVGVVAQVAAVVCNTNVGGILGTLAAGQDATCQTDGGTLVFDQTAAQ